MVETTKETEVPGTQGTGTNIEYVPETLVKDESTIAGLGLAESGIMFTITLWNG